MMDDDEDFGRDATPEEETLIGEIVRLRTALDAATTRAEAAEARASRIESDRPYIIGANDGWDEAVSQGAASEAVKSAIVRFWKRLAEVERNRAEAAEAAAKTARDAMEEIAAAVGCLEGKDALDRELIRNIKASLALIKKEQI